MVFIHRRLLSARAKAASFFIFAAKPADMKKIVIAIDGYSSCGKSTLAKGLAAALGYAYIDSGAMYRAVTLYLIQHHIDPADEEAVAGALPYITIHFENIGLSNHTFLNGEDVEDAIRQMEVSENVSQVSIISAVRRAMVKQQKAMGRRKSIVMDGRDIGTVVFPEAELKIFLTADPEVRAQRRYKELVEKGVDVAMEAVRRNLAERDRIDSTRADSPLRQAEGAIVLDNTHLTHEAQLEKAIQLAEAAQLQTADQSISL